MSDKEHKKAIISFLFLKEKQDQTVQGMMVADGRKQWKIAVNLEVALLTVCGVNLHHSSNSGVWEERCGNCGPTKHIPPFSKWQGVMQGWIAELMGGG